MSGLEPLTCSYERATPTVASVVYNPVFFASILAGKSRQMSVGFFLRIARVLDLSEEEKDALVRSWPFGVERESY